MTSVGATAVREGFLEEVVHSAFQHLSMNGLLAPSAQLASSCFSLWPNGAIRPR